MEYRYNQDIHSTRLRVMTIHANVHYNKNIVYNYRYRTSKYIPYIDRPMYKSIIFLYIV